MPKEKQLSHTITGIWEPEKKGESLLGFFREKITIPGSTFDNSLYLIGKNDSSEVIGLNSYAVLERAFDRVNENDFVQVVYQGMKKGEKYDYKYFTVRAWELSNKECEEWNEKVDFSKLNLKKREQKEEDKKPDPVTQSDDKDNDLPF